MGDTESNAHARLKREVRGRLSLELAVEAGTEGSRATSSATRFLDRSIIIAWHVSLLPRSERHRYLHVYGGWKCGQF
jgi:hypothetical protein